MKRIIVLVALCCGLAGCSASGSKYEDTIASLSAPAEGTSRIFILRPKESGIPAGPANIHVDSEKVAQVKARGFVVVDVASGQHTLKADDIQAAGSCRLTVEVAEGREYYFGLSSRQSNIWAGIAGSAFDDVTYGILGGLAGQAIESSGKECGGAVAITPLKKDLAIDQLQKLHYSD